MGWDLVANFLIDQREVPTDLTEEELEKWFIATKLNNEVPKGVRVHSIHYNFIHCMQQASLAYGTNANWTKRRFPYA
jgi:hypothetical protein